MTPSAPRRVTVVAHELRGFHPSGGMGTATTFLALALARLGHDVEILVGVNRPPALDPHWRDVYDRAGVRLRFAPLPDDRIEPWHFRHSHAIALGLREQPTEVVVTPDFGAAAYVALLLRHTGVAFDDTLFVTFCHGPRRYVMDVNGVVAPNDLRTLLATGVQEQTCIELSDVVVSPSRYLLEWMRAEGWRLPEQTHVIPYFTQATATGDPPRRAHAAAGSRLERLVFFGRVDERKGLKPFAAGVNAIEPALLDGIEIEFVGRTSETWTRERVTALFSERTRAALCGLSFASGLDQHEALARLSRPGTVAIMPSLEENSPNAIYECLELGIPFLASNVGGVPELITPDDRGRVLFAPTADGVAGALRPLLEEHRVPPPVRAAFAPDASSDAWNEVVLTKPTQEAQTATADDLVVVADGDTSVDADVVAALTRAQAITQADAVTCGIRVGNTVHFFAGNPRGLGALSNAYGTVAVVRRSLVEREGEPVWPLLARLTATGRRMVSVPEPLLTQTAPPGTVESGSADALGAVQELERALPPPLRSLARLGAGLAADAPGPSPRRRRSFGFPFVVVALTVVGAALRFATLGRQSYWYDELATVAVLRHSFGGMLHAVASREATPYLYYVLAWPWSRIFGFGEAALRSLSALVGTLTIPATYAAARAFTSARAAVVAAALVTFNPFLVWYSQEARSYALFAFLAALTLAFLARRDLVWWSVTASLAVATHYFAVFLVAAEALVLLQRDRSRRVLAAAAVPTVVALAQIPLLAKQQGNGGNLGDSPLVHRLAGIPKDLLVGYSLPAEAAVAAIAAVLALVGFVLAVRRRAFMPLAVGIVMLVVPTVVALAGADYVVARNMIAVAIPVALALGAGYASRRVGIASAVALCALSLGAVVSVAADRRYGRTDWRGAAHALGTSSRARAIVVTPTIDATLLRPYLRGLDQPATLRVSEIDVVGLATQGGFSSGTVHPPDAAPRPAPAGFRVAERRQTSTYALVRYAADGPRDVSAATLGALRLSETPGAVFLQTPR